MKTIMFLLRYLCLMALILVVVYAPDALLYGSSGAAEQMPCYETVVRVWSQWLQGTWYQEAWFLITAGILLILAFARGVTAIWNVLYALSLILMLAAGSLFFINLPLALPSAIGSMPELQFLPTLYRTEAALVSFIPVVFILGLLLSNARVRIFLYTVICYALWYGLSELFTYLLSLWQQAETPFMPEVLAFLYDTRWLLVVLIGAFLLVYDLILAFTETFTKPATKPKEEQKGGQSQESTTPGQKTAKTETKPASTPKTSATPQPKVASVPSSEPKPAALPTTPKPTPAPQPSAQPASAATPKRVTTPPPAPKPATSTKPAVITVRKVTPKPRPETPQATTAPSAASAPAETETENQPESHLQSAAESPSAPMPEPTATSTTISPAVAPPPAPMPIAKPFAPTDEKLDEPSTSEESTAAPAEEKDDAGAAPAEPATPTTEAPSSETTANGATPPESQASTAKSEA